MQTVKEIITAYGIPPQLIQLELTETAYLENTDVLLEIMEQLSTFGVTLAVDDFGTGYSSLNMLRTLPVDVLKLDKAFLNTFEQSRSRNIMHHVVELAHDMGMQVVLEIEPLPFAPNIGELIGEAQGINSGLVLSKTPYTLTLHLPLKLGSFLSTTTPIKF